MDFSSQNPIRHRALVLILTLVTLSSKVSTQSSSLCFDVSTPGSNLSTLSASYSFNLSAPWPKSVSTLMFSTLITHPTVRGNSNKTLHSRRGGGRFIAFLNVVLMLLKVKSHAREQDQALNATLFLIHFTFQVIKTVIFETKMSHGGRGSEKGQCFIYFASKESAVSADIFQTSPLSNVISISAFLAPIFPHTQI